ncbi:YbaK/EbsC family protein [Celerinatantimonas yamalensis]|uniref:Cys-tRNA(Pro)/Cys-tRNA(Cys) deacylase n=1 Tax=Celerinatantimonas yamalensis TaxID=559956 RepID=A0ABW9G8A2_9GAMM
MTMEKTAIQVYLDEQSIAYQAVNFIRDGDALTPYPKPMVAWSCIYKTLALTGKRTGPVIAVVPVHARLSYKKLAQLTGNRSVGMVPEERLVATTGYVHGANNPIGIWRAKQFPIFIDAQAQTQTTICVSAGEIGRAMLIDRRQLAALVQAKFAVLVEA